MGVDGPGLLEELTILGAALLTPPDGYLDRDRETERLDRPSGTY